MDLLKRHIKICFLTLMMSMAVHFTKAQCNPNFDDTSTVCGTVTFTNLSTPSASLVSYNWSFPGASPSTTNATNPTATYTANGTYTVCLVMTIIPTCSASICKTISISCFSPSCTANFNTGTCDTTGTNAQISFTNTSSGTNGSTVYHWDFGNNTTSTLTSPVGTYTADGVYTVCLSYTTSVPACTASICKSVTINCVPTATPCSANFNSVSCVQSGTNAQVTFTTNAATNYTWSFGNSTGSSLQNPTATFTANGTYNVCLSIITGSPPCADTVCKAITVTCAPTPSPPPCQANFTNTPCSNGQTTFYSTSTGTIAGNTTYTWTNTAPPNQPNPPSAYTATVCLKIANTGSAACTSSVCKTVLIDCAGIGFAEFNAQNNKIDVFPNPGNGLFTLDMSGPVLNSPLIEIKVYNILGELVYKSKEDIDPGKVNKEINLQYLSNGAYYLRLNSGNNTYSAKLIISR